MKVLSLFGGIECGLVALKKLWYPVTEYYSSEVDSYASKITSKNHPEVVHIGDVKEVKYRFWKLQWATWEQPTTIDLLIGGSPCQDLSIAKAGGKGLNWEKSGLFFEYMRILTETKPKYFLLENVASMKKADKDEITRIVWVEPIMINSALVSWQNRKRLYWTNIPGVVQPEDRGILLSDILEDIQLWDERWRELDEKYLRDEVKERMEEKARTITASYGKGPSLSNLWTHRERTLIIWQFRRTQLRIHADQDKVCTLTSNMGTGGNNVPIILGLVHRNRGEWKRPECNLTEKANSLTTVQSDSEIIARTDEAYFWRKLTPIECERLQTLPDNYTACVSDSRRYKAIGNGWTVDTIAHIFSFIKI